MSRRQWEKQARKTANKKARKALKAYKKQLQEDKWKRWSEDMKRISYTLRKNTLRLEQMRYTYESIQIMKTIEFGSIYFRNTCSAPDCSGCCEWTYCPAHLDQCIVVNCSYRTRASWRNGSRYCQQHGCSRHIDWNLGNGWLYCGNPKMPVDKYCLNCKIVITLYLCLKPVFGKDVTKIIIRIAANVRML